MATILVVDDDLPTRSIFEKLLRLEGYEVVTASDGLSALEEFAARRPDLVLLDVMMPGVDGFEVCRQIKADPENRLRPVVLVTGLTATEDRIKGLEMGADDFVSKPIDRSELRARLRSLLNLKTYTDELDRSESVLFALARSIEAKDPYTEGHCERLSELSVRLGERLGLPAEQVAALRRAGVVHDIGKVAVPDSILLKRGQLTSNERRIMQQHPVVGEHICAPLQSFRAVLPVIRHHHEKLDGSGYPDRLKGKDIPLTARVLQIVDVYDALTTERPYKKALRASAALKIMEEEVNKGWWDPELFVEFRRILPDNTAPAAQLGQ